MVGLDPLRDARRRIVAIAVVGTFGLMSCGSDRPSAGDDDVARSTTSRTASTSTSQPEVEPRAYLAEVERLVRAHAYYADRVDWTAWEADASAIAAEADRSSDTYETGDRLLGRLDRHSGLDRHPGPGRGGGELRSSGPLPEATVDDGIGRLVLPRALWDPETAPGADYVTEARAGLDARACGWIVDLRADGGNLWTLLMGLAPLLGPGSAVGYRYRDGRTGELVIGEDGSLAGFGRPAVTLSGGTSIDFGATDDPVAVIQSHRTASAHEGAVMAFRGRPATRSFGTSTNGVPTARQDYDMADGSVLFLTTAVGVDSAGTVWEDSIPPDEAVPLTPTAPRSPGQVDAALDAAQDWLASRPECR